MLCFLGFFIIIAARLGSPSPIFRYWLKIYMKKDRNVHSKMYILHYIIQITNEKSI